MGSVGSQVEILNTDNSGVATIEATEAAGLAKIEINQLGNHAAGSNPLKINTANVRAAKLNVNVTILFT